MKDKLEFIKKNKKDVIIFNIMFLITLLIFYNFVTMHYSADTYNIINRGYKEYAIKYSLNDGRVFMCLISLIADLFNIPIQIYIIVLTILALFISCISVMLIKKEIIKYFNKDSIINEIMVTLAAYVVIFNFTYLDCMVFAECAVIALSILLYIISAIIIINKPKRYRTKSLLLTILAIFCYQGTINFIVTLTFVLSLLKEKKINKQLIKDTLLSGVWVIIGIGLNLIQIKITGYFFGLSQMRMGSIKNISNNIKYIFRNLWPILKENKCLFPKGLLLVFLIYIIGIQALYIRNKNDMLKLFNVICIIIVAITTTFLPNLMTLASFGVGRMIFSVGALVGLLLIYLLVNNIENKKIIYVFYSILILYIIITISTYISIMFDHKKVNEQTKYEAEMIGKWIKEYEVENNTKINYIRYYYKIVSNHCYNNIKNKSDMCNRAIYLNWSRTGAINYYNNMNLKEPDDMIEKYYRCEYNNNWNSLQREQLVFKDDVVTLYIY